jgi:hypothetical protein
LAAYFPGLGCHDHSVVNACFQRKLIHGFSMTGIIEGDNGEIHFSQPSEQVQLLCKTSPDQGWRKDQTSGVAGSKHCPLYLAVF